MKKLPKIIILILFIIGHANYIDATQEMNIFSYKYPKIVRNNILSFTGVNAPDTYGRLQLQCNNSLLITKTLIACQADVNRTTDNDRDTPLCIAIKRYSAVTKILESEDPEDQDRSCIITHFLITEQKKQLLIFQCLLQAKADCNKLNEHGKATLYHAINPYAIPLLTALLTTKKMDLSEKSCHLENYKLGLTAMDYAKLLAMNRRISPQERTKYYEICDILKKYNALSCVQLESMPTQASMRKEYHNANMREEQDYIVIEGEYIGSEPNNRYRCLKFLCCFIKFLCCFN